MAENDDLNNPNYDVDLPTLPVVPGFWARVSGSAYSDYTEMANAIIKQMKAEIASMKAQHEEAMKKIGAKSDDLDRRESKLFDREIQMGARERQQAERIAEKEAELAEKEAALNAKLAEIGSVEQLRKDTMSKNRSLNSKEEQLKVREAELEGRAKEVEAESKKAARQTKAADDVLETFREKHHIRPEAPKESLERDKYVMDAMLELQARLMELLKQQEISSKVERTEKEVSSEVERICLIRATMIGIVRAYTDSLPQEDRASFVIDGKSSVKYLQSQLSAIENDQSKYHLDGPRINSALEDSYRNMYLQIAGHNVKIVRVIDIMESIRKGNAETGKVKIGTGENDNLMDENGSMLSETVRGSTSHADDYYKGITMKQTPRTSEPGSQKNGAEELISEVAGQLDKIIPPTTEGKKETPEDGEAKTADDDEPSI